MAAPRRFELEDILNRPGTYFNPETEVLLIIDDAPEVDPELFEEDDQEGWVLIGDDGGHDPRTFLDVALHRRDRAASRVCYAANAC